MGITQHAAPAGGSKWLRCCVARISHATATRLVVCPSHLPSLHAPLQMVGQFIWCAAHTLWIGSSFMVRGCWLGLPCYNALWCSRLGLPACLPACLLQQQLRWMAASKQANNTATSSCTAVAVVAPPALCPTACRKQPRRWASPHECSKRWERLLPLNTCSLPSLVTAGSHLAGPHGAPPVWVLARRLPPQAKVWRGAVQTKSCAPWSLQHCNLPLLFSTSGVRERTHRAIGIVQRTHYSVNLCVSSDSGCRPLRQSRSGRARCPSRPSGRGGSSCPRTITRYACSCLQWMLAMQAALPQLAARKRQGSTFQQQQLPRDY